MCWSALFTFSAVVFVTYFSDFDSFNQLFWKDWLNIPSSLKIFVGIFKISEIEREQVWSAHVYEGWISREKVLVSKLTLIFPKSIFIWIWKQSRYFKNIWIGVSIFGKIRKWASFCRVSCFCFLRFHILLLKEACSVCNYSHHLWKLKTVLL